MKNTLSFWLCILNLQTLTCLAPALRILDGRNARPGEFPFAVRLETHVKTIYPNRTVLKIWNGCSGAALTATWTLSAAHCASTLYSQDDVTDHYRIEIRAKIRYGNPNLKPSENNQLSSILSSEKPASRHAIDDDIALFHTEPIKVEGFAKLSGVEYRALVGRQVTLIGFGMARVTPGVYDFDLTYNLDKPLQVIDEALLIGCPRQETMKLCVAVKCGSSQAVGAGDSGSPALLDSTIVAVAIKVSDVFFQATRPSLKPVAKAMVYTPVSLYLDWISSIISKNDLNNMFEL